MRSDDVLRECLSVHRRLLRVEQDLHRWIREMTGIDVEPSKTS